MKQADRNMRKVILLVAVALPICVIVALAIWSRVKGPSEADFMELMHSGKNYYESGDAQRAIDLFSRAVAVNPTDADARLNLANAYLLAGQPEEAIRQAELALSIDPQSAAAYFVKGSAHIRLGQYEEAVKALQESTRLDDSVAAAFFQLGVAHQQLRQWEDALTAFQIATEIDPNHPAAHYNLSQVLVRIGRPEEAQQELALHREIATNAPPQMITAATYERSPHTQARVPFQIEQPDLEGIPVTFTQVTQQMLPATNFQGPIGVIDIHHDGFNDLLVREGTNGFRLLLNQNGRFNPSDALLPVIPGAVYTDMLIADLNRDRYEDAILLGPQGSHVFKFATNGAISEVTPFTRLDQLKAIDGALVDLDFTGNADLIVATSSNTLQVFRNLGNLLFKNITETSGVPASVTTAHQVTIDDLNNDDLMDVLVARSGEPPLVLLKQRGGPLTATNMLSDPPVANRVAIGDLNNDLRADLVFATEENLQLLFTGSTNRVTLPSPAQGQVQALALVDYDNDGWLDIVSGAEGIRVWRNIGQSGFVDTTSQIGLGQVQGRVQGIVAADLEKDGDTDLLLDMAGTGLQLWRNEGGNANYQLKLRLVGNRSNPSGIGVRVELAASGWRTSRTVRQLPIEIGVGKHRKLDALTVRWFDLPWNQVDVEVDPNAVLEIMEPILPTGSCPYLYAWDGERFRFVTDLLGSAPLGLPVADGVYIDADPDEYVWIGNESNFRPRGDEYVLQLTEELREVLYLDEAKLVVVDHPPGTEVYPTDKLLPRKPFPPGELMLLERPHRVQHARRSDGLDVTQALQEVDGRMASPVQLRVPQLRGLAEPYAIELDFGPLAIERPLVLGITGWLRFGGGAANMSAARMPDLPFPFPKLEVELRDGRWIPVDVQAGAPAGKTKRWMIDLDGKLPEGSRRLRVSTAFEIHWDQVLLFEKATAANMRVVSLAAGTTDLHWRGYSEFEDLPDFLPLTPDYSQVRQNARWRITPSGWCTRYGPVDELIARKDNALALLNGGDELTLTFPVNQLPPKPDGYVRDFFLFSVGWDKDADFHVAHGTTVEPLPFHGMDDQQYGKQPRPVTDGDWWIEKYNTRWVGPITLDRERTVASPGPAD